MNCHFKLQSITCFTSVSVRGKKQHHLKHNFKTFIGHNNFGERPLTQLTYLRIKFHALYQPTTTVIEDALSSYN